MFPRIAKIFKFALPITIIIHQMNFIVKYIYILLILLFLAACGTRDPEVVVEGEDTETNVPEETRLPEKTLYKAKIYKTLSKYKSVYQNLEELAKDAKRKGFNGSILVSVKDKLHFEKAIGYRDLRNKLLLEKHTAFQLASVSKQFTAISIVLLREKAKLDYNDKVNKYIPSFPYKEITIANLLNHSSGLPNYMRYFEDTWKDERIPSNDDILNWLSRKKPDLLFKPGATFSYSNTGYVVLASLVEKISGMPFKDFLAKNIFQPLGMEHTYLFSTNFSGIPGDRLTGFFTNRGRKERDPETVNDGAYGDKGVYSTIEDMFAWMSGLESGKIISRISLNKAISTSKLKTGREVKYGFGFRIREFDNSNIFYHYGKWNSFRTYSGNYFDKDAIVIILNNSNHRIKWIVEEIEKILWPENSKNLFNDDELSD